MTNMSEPEWELYTKVATEKKARDVVVLDVHDVTSIADYFIICSGSSNRQVSAIAEHIQMELKKKGKKPISVDGLKEGHWVLMDYGHVIYHVFYEPVRRFYDLESLWIDAKKINIPTTEGDYENDREAEEELENNDEW